METITAADARFTMPAATVRLLLRPDEAAQVIGVSRSRFYQLLSQGLIKSIRVGRSRRVPLAELQRWVNDELAQQSA
jgi:excisionase family DNA binding protein